MDLGVGEIGMLLILAVLMFGPEKIPPLARKAAKVIHFLRGIANDATSQLRSELGPEYANLSITDLNPKTFIAKHLLGDLQEDLNEIKEDLGSIKKDFEAEGKDLTEIEKAIKNTDDAMATASRAAATAGNYWTAAPFDAEAT
ncbi:sec-independent translocase [Propionibacteriaceae bacterium Y1923]|uniref:sec-independent translocase n=1 Tax=Aestuariimicrobium sp. Y1814 TaxID=3418742 RepID=UPI003C25F615